MNKSAKDHLYATRQDSIEGFVFDEKVATVFADMIQRSVPGYAVVNQLLPIIAGTFIQPGANVYDLGCSLGEASINICQHTAIKDVTIYAVDNSPAMIDRLQARLAQIHAISIKPVCADVLDVNIKDAAFVILNYTLQFIKRSQRESFIARIYSGMRTNGALLLSEKLIYEDAREAALMQKLHESYKRENEYSDLEISQKREALENVLLRDTHEQHLNRLQNTGFSMVYVIARYLNFITYVAVK